MAECSLNGLKTLCEKEKLLVTSNFSFSHSVFKRLVLQTPENLGLVGKGLKPFSKQQILDSSKLEDFADESFNFDESSRKFSKKVENTVGKGEIARHEQLLLFPQCFQKTHTADT